KGQNLGRFPRKNPYCKVVSHEPSRHVRTKHPQALKQTRSEVITHTKSCFLPPCSTLSSSFSSLSSTFSCPHPRPYCPRPLSPCPPLPSPCSRLACFFSPLPAPTVPSP
ncbi:unnamed protein product, partial [Sphacelaria rigidula]